MPEAESSHFTYHFNSYEPGPQRDPHTVQAGGSLQPLYYRPQPLADCHSNLPGTAINQLQLRPHYQLMSMRTDKAWTSKTMYIGFIGDGPPNEGGGGGGLDRCSEIIHLICLFSGSFSFLALVSLA